MDERQRQRVALLRNHEVTVTAYHLFAYPSLAVEMAGHLRHSVDGLEIQFAASQADEFDDLAPSDLPLTLCPISTGVVTPGKQHPRTRVGYGLEEAADLAPGHRRLCRIASGEQIEPWLTTRVVTAGFADLVLDLPSEDDAVNASTVAHGLLAVATAPGVRLFVDPLIDYDRTIDVVHGLIDTRCNPRPAMTVVRMLNTILFSHGEAWSLETSDPWTLSSSQRRLTLCSEASIHAHTVYGLTTGTLTDSGQNLGDPLLLHEQPF